MNPIYDGQDTRTPQQRDNETLEEAKARYEWGKATEDFVRENHGRMKIEGGLDEIQNDCKS